MRKLRAIWQSTWADVDRRVRLGRLVGFGLLVAGFIVIGKAWDGAASKNFITGQFPYLLSGGFFGLGLVVTGSTLLFLSTVRAERQILTEKFDELSVLLSRNLARLQLSGDGARDKRLVVTGKTAYHEPGCRVLEGKDELTMISVEQAAAEGLNPCRVCDPPRAEEGAEQGAPVSAGSETPAP